MKLFALTFTQIVTDDHALTTDTYKVVQKLHENVMRRRVRSSGLA